MKGIYEESDNNINDGEDDIEGAAPTPKHQRIAWEEALEQSLSSGFYL